jgi:hypothetical protein
MPAPPRVDVTRARELARQGLDVRAIAYRLGVTPNAVYRVIKDIRRKSPCV